MRIYLAATLIGLAAAVACAQTGYVPGGGDGYYVPGYGYGGYGYSHSSTEAEGTARGLADIVRSAGAANLMNSEAAKTLEEARKKYIENRLQATETYFAMRRVNEEARDAKRRPLSMEQYVRLARQQAPERLSVSQLDPFSGTIGWPTVLRDEKFKADREAIEQLFRERARGIAFNYAEIEKACDALLDRLGPEANTLDANNFIRAKKFVESLKHEVRLAQG
jgi:hypothetical protein